MGYVRKNFVGPSLASNLEVFAWLGAQPSQEISSHREYVTSEDHVVFGLPNGS